MPRLIQHPVEEDVLIEYPDEVSDYEVYTHLDSLVNDPYGPSAWPDDETFRAVAEWFPGFGEYYAVKDLQEWYKNYQKLSPGQAVDPNEFLKALPSLAGIMIGAGEAKSIKEGILRILDITTGKTKIRGKNLKARSLLKAQDMESEMLQQGKSRKEVNEEIFAKTGWWRDVDGEWKFEISDRDAKLKKPVGLPGKEWDTAGTAKLGDVLDHPELFKEYPQLADYEIDILHEPDPDKLHEYRGSLGYEGLFEPDEKMITITGRDEAEIKNILLHEIQHAIQNKENFGIGGNSGMKEWLHSKYIQDIDKINPLLLNPDIPNIDKEELIRLHKKEYENLKRLETVAPDEIYWRLKGEIEARNVQFRDQLRALLEQYDPNDLTKSVYVRRRGFKSKLFSKEDAEYLLTQLPTATEEFKDSTQIVVKPYKRP